MSDQPKTTAEAIADAEAEMAASLDGGPALTTLAELEDELRASGE